MTCEIDAAFNNTYTVSSNRNLQYHYLAIPVLKLETVTTVEDKDSFIHSVTGSKPLTTISLGDKNVTYIKLNTVRIVVG